MTRKYEMTDHARILTEVLLRTPQPMYTAPDLEATYVPVHIAKYREPVPGDLVLGFCIRKADPFCLSWLVRRLGDSEYLLREIGTQRTARYWNVQFNAVVGLPPSILLEGDRRGFYWNVMTVMSREADWAYRFGGVDFDGERATIWIREVFNGRDVDGTESKPFGVEMPWSKRTTRKAILAALLAGGLNTRKFERKPADGKSA